MVTEVAENKNKGKRLLVFLLIILAITNCVTLFLYFHKATIVVKTEEQLLSTTDLKIELEKKVQEYQSKLTEYSGKINEKDSTLVQLKKELETKVTEIQGMISDVRITKEKYEKAKDEIEGLKYYIEKYQKQIDELQKQNVALTNENMGLKEDVKKNKKVMDNLQDENVKLSNKVSLGSRLIANNINVTGIQLKESGKQKETMKGSRMDGIRLTFTLRQNIMADKGNYEVYIRIINPKGETLFIEGTGSGKFQIQGEEALYTVKEKLEYTSDETKVYTVFWAKGSAFEKGTYKAELYTQGLLTGQTTFEVK
jgi:DNA repair ATPase RecN